MMCAQFWNVDVEEDIREANTTEHKFLGRETSSHIGYINLEPKSSDRRLFSALSQETQILTELSSRGVQSSAYDLSTLTTLDTHTVNTSGLVEEVVSGVLTASADLNVVIVSTLALAISIFNNVSNS